MRLFAHPKDPATLPLNQQRGNVWTDNGYADDLNLPPYLLVNYRDRYRRVFPDGPYDRSWQGVQKINPISALSVGRQAIPNPLQSQSLRIPRTNWNNPTSHSIGAGTALAAYNVQQEALAQQVRPGILSTIVGRLRGNG